MHTKSNIAQRRKYAKKNIYIYIYIYVLVDCVVQSAVYIVGNLIFENIA